MSREREEPKEDAGLLISLTEVKEKGQAEVDVSVPAELVGVVLEGGEILGTLQLKGTVTQQEDEAAFAGSVRGRWRIDCVRCLKPVEGEYAAVVEVRGPIDGGPLDVSDEVRQSIVLAQPMKTYCREDCKGLCPVCRKDRNAADCGHKTPEALERPVNRPRRA
jgi:uncharacterized protein